MGMARAGGWYAHCFLKMCMRSHQSSKDSDPSVLLSHTFSQFDLFLVLGGVFPVCSQTLVSKQTQVTLQNKALAPSSSSFHQRL